MIKDIDRIRVYDKEGNAFDQIEIPEGATIEIVNKTGKTVIRIESSYLLED